jgi:hypothetical protein
MVTKGGTKGEVLVTAELYQVLQPFIFVTRTFGFLPIICKKSGSDYKLRWSLFYTVYSYILGSFMSN